MAAIHGKPLVSVIIPAYNQGELLAKAIESALAQAYSPVEIVVVNDGSTDDAVRLTAQRYADCILYIEQQNGGIASARNTGIRSAHGELIAFLDQDDVWLPHKLATEVSALQAHPDAGLVHSSYYLIDEVGQRTGVVRLPEREWKPLPELLLDVPIASCTALFPRHVLDEVGLLDANMGGSDDWDLWLRLAARGYRFYCIGQPLACYRVHSQNTSKDIDFMVRSGLGVLEKFYSSPDVPPEAERWGGRAFAKRHAWASAIYYGAGRLGLASSHLRKSIRFYPRGLASTRLLQSFIYARADQPSHETAEEAVHFIQSIARTEQVSRDITKKLNARVYMVMALHNSTNRRSIRFVKAILADPRLFLDPEIRSAVVRRIRRAITALREKGLIVKNSNAGQVTPWYRPTGFKYGGALSLAAMEPNSSHGKMLQMLSPGLRVLETGCANGRFSRVLVEYGCQVVGVEIDPDAAVEAAQVCERVIVGNLEEPEVQAQIPGEFDVLLFGDVLEHLVQPWQVLRALRSRLKPGGYVVASIPNVAHWDVRMSLLAGNFNYQYDGLLDSTHLRFFTQRTVWEMMEQSGYRVVDYSRATSLPAWVYSIRLVRRYAPRVLLPLLERIAPNLVTFQFIVKAIPNGKRDA